jgi:hypothetical protein
MSEEEFGVVRCAFHGRLESGVAGLAAAIENAGF